MWFKPALLKMIIKDEIRYVYLYIRIFVGFLLVVSAHAAGLPDEIFGRLKSEEFKVREEAQTQMLQWAKSNPAIAVDALYRQSQIAADPEQRTRCLSVLRNLILEEFDQRGQGFVGIQMQDTIAKITEEGKPLTMRAVRITHILPGMAAEAAGLKANDTIIGLNGKKWTNEVVTDAFMDSIKKLKPGTKVKLQILRMNTVHEVEVTLCRRPQTEMDPRFELNLERFEAKKQAEKEAYFQGWLEQRKAIHD